MEKTVKDLTLFNISEIGSEKFWNQYDTLLDIYQLFNTEDHAQQDAAAKILFENDKIRDLVHSAVVMEYWEDKILPSICKQMKGHQKVVPTVCSMIFYNSLVLSMLEKVLCSKYVAMLGENTDYLLDLAFFIGRLVSMSGNADSANEEHSDDLVARIGASARQNSVKSSIIIARLLIDNHEIVPISCFTYFFTTFDMLDPMAEGLLNASQQGRAADNGQTWVSLASLVYYGIGRYRLSSGVLAKLKRLGELIDDDLLDDIPFLSRLKELLVSLNLNEKPGSLPLLIEEIPPIHQDVEASLDVRRLVNTQIRRYDSSQFEPRIMKIMSLSCSG